MTMGNSGQQMQIAFFTKVFTGGSPVVVSFAEESSRIGDENKYKDRHFVAVRPQTHTSLVRFVFWELSGRNVISEGLS